MNYANYQHNQTQQLATVVTPFHYVLPSFGRKEEGKDIHGHDNEACGSLAPVSDEDGDYDLPRQTPTHHVVHIGKVKVVPLIHIMHMYWAI